MLRIRVQLQHFKWIRIRIQGFDCNCYNKDMDPTGSVINWPRKSGSWSGLRVRGSGSERNIYRRRNSTLNVEKREDIDKRKLTNLKYSVMAELRREERFTPWKYSWYQKFTYKKKTLLRSTDELKLLWRLFSTLFIFRPSDSYVSEDAVIEPRTVATLVLAVRSSNHLTRSHPELD